jgi:DNA polymerase elongation subunit (family B)
MQLLKIRFIDIETVPMAGEFNDLPKDLSHLWEEKFNALRQHNPAKFDNSLSAENAFAENAGIYAEFGKIICISIGFIYLKNGESHFRVTSYAEDDEKKLLTAFAADCPKLFPTSEYCFCGHNIKEFDIPYICRRLLINGIQLPKALNISGKKPWELTSIDTMELWKFGDYKNFTSLKLLTAIFGIPTPKDDINGSQVASVYYQENNLPRICIYCQKDVVATAQVFLKINGMKTIPPENVEIITKE